MARLLVHVMAVGTWTGVTAPTERLLAATAFLSTTHSSPLHRGLAAGKMTSGPHCLSERQLTVPGSWTTAVATSLHLLCSRHAEWRSVTMQHVGRLDVGYTVDHRRTCTSAG